MPPFIFRFHKGTNNNIIDWTASDKITSADTKDVMDKTNILSSSAGTSIPTPIARMFLFKTAYEIVTAQIRDLEEGEVVPDSIYARLVSESLDLLELLYKSGSDVNKFSYHKWTFEDGDNAANFFGKQPGHKLLSKSFVQAATQAPFNKKIEITLIYYKEGSKEVLVGGTSPFTFVFTSPNFKRKMAKRGFKPVSGLVSENTLFGSKYLQLHERDLSFIKYAESLISKEDSGESFKSFNEYVTHTRLRFENKFEGTLPTLQDIQFDDMPLMAGNIQLQQISEADYKETINLTSDFRMELPKDTLYKKSLTPLFLLDRMSHDGQYSSASNSWSSKTTIAEMEYPETDVDEIMNRELPGLNDFKYPFLSSFDFFEKFLVRLPGYALNDERFITLTDNQVFAYPIKPIFFHFFPISRIKDYLSVEVKNNEVTFIIKINISGPTKGRRTIVSRKTYDSDTFINYSGILGMFPFTKMPPSPEFGHVNQYTVAAYEKTNGEILLHSLNFLNGGIEPVANVYSSQRSKYTDRNIKTTYYEVSGSFEIIHLNFAKNGMPCGGIILPKFQEVENGIVDYIYAIDFGTSNTHIEYGAVESNGNGRQINKTFPFTIDKEAMQMFLLHKPKEKVLNDGNKYTDYETSMGTPMISSKLMALREFVPFEIGNQKAASIRFPFRTATCESDAFAKNHGANARLFNDANIGFYIDDDLMSDDVRYKTDLKWILQNASVDQANINRVTLFARQLMLMIRTKALLEGNNRAGDLSTLRIILSFPISMGPTLKKKLEEIFEAERKSVFGQKSQPLAEPVTESIAPYYQLKWKNIKIQNDNFCNIDIGGGTTDIVLTKTEASKNSNQLQCFCSSIRFAGRQLWSSGGNENNNDDNGFVAYYKEFIPKKDPGVVAELEGLLNGHNIRTEDIVGLLFSKPQYKFKEIFLYNKEFKVVPLIHYAAILYYITKLAKWKNIELPRTVSFSGKGSEYLNLLFTSDADLKGFTQKMLGIFSGVKPRNDFMVERGSEPKVITAKGALHYAVEDVADDTNEGWGNDSDSGQRGNEKKLIKNEVVYKGFNDLTLENTAMTYADLLNNEDFYQDIIKSHIEFFDLLFGDNDLVGAINKKMELGDFSKYKEFFIPDNDSFFNEGVLRDSFKATLSRLDLTEKVADSPFFFLLNYSLIDLSRKIASDSTIK